MTDYSDANWSRSSFCGASAGCLEASRAGRLVLVRDSKTAPATGLIQQWTADEWVDLLHAIKLGVHHVGIDPIDPGVWFGLHRHELLEFTGEEWDAFVAGVNAGEFDYAKLPSYASTLSRPAPSEGCDAGQEVGPAANGPNLAATGAGAIAVPPVPVAARVRATAIRGALYDSLSPNFEIDSDGYDDAAVAVAKLLEPVETPEQSAAIVDANLRDMGSRGLDAAPSVPVAAQPQPVPIQPENLLDVLTFRIADPGTFVHRKLSISGVPMETVPRWAARAVAAGIEDGTLGYVPAEQRDSYKREVNALNDLLTTARTERDRLAVELAALKRHASHLFDGVDAAYNFANKLDADCCGTYAQQLRDAIGKAGTVPVAAQPPLATVRCPECGNGVTAVVEALAVGEAWPKHYRKDVAQGCSHWGMFHLIRPEHIEAPAPVAAQPIYILDRDAIVDMVERYGNARADEVGAGEHGSYAEVVECASQAEDLLHAIRGALTPVPAVEPEPRWGAGPLVEHVPETPAEQKSGIYVYFMHDTLTPGNVRATRTVSELPTVGEVFELEGAGLYGADAVWQVVRVEQHHRGTATCYMADATETSPGTGSAVPDREEIARRDRLAESWAEDD